MTTRRQFLATSSGLLLSSLPLQAIEPIQREGKSSLKRSLAAYSFRKYLGLNIKPKPPMDLMDFAKFASELPLDAIEPTSYYFSDTSKKYLNDLKSLCKKLKLEISGTAVRNDFCHTDPKKLKADLNHVKKWVEHAARLGCKTIRIFAGRVAKGDTLEAAQKRCIATTEEACEFAGKHGIILALENHGGITSTADQLLALVKPVKSKWFGVNLDTGNFRTEDPYGDLERLASYAVTVQIKTEIAPKGQKKQEADLPRLIQLLRKVNYSGYVALEYEASEEPKVAVPRYVKQLSKLIQESN